MELTFEENAVIGTGNYPDFVQFDKTDGELFFLSGGSMYGKPSGKFDGQFDTPVWDDVASVNPDGDTDMENLELKVLPGFGIVGTYTTETAQKLLIYEYQHDVSKYLSNGNVRYAIDSPIATFSLTMDNPVDRAVDTKHPVLLNEVRGLVSPGSKVIFQFSMGDGEPWDLGVFYVDDTYFRVGQDTAALNGRNLIGKALKDQTVNENGATTYKLVSDIFEDFLYYANLTHDQFMIQIATESRKYSFDPNKTILSCLEEMFKTLVTWRVEELPDGTVVIGNADYAQFPTRGIYTFVRGTDVFSRGIKMDDAEAYSKVCVHTSDWSPKVYMGVPAYEGWDIRASKTLFVTVPDGTSTDNATEIATELVARLSNSGKVETFEGPFRPQLLVGDEAVITDSNGQDSLGLITEITHSFGKSGFKTTFTVDSGGRLGQGRLKDYIEKINRTAAAGSIEYEAPVP